MTSDSSIDAHVETLIFTATTPITVSEMKACLDALWETDVKTDTILQALQRLVEKYQSDEYAFEIIESGGGYQFLTKRDYFDTAAQLRKQKSNRRLSRAMLETLAIIAYKQPVTKLEIDQIRGVNSDYVVRKLLEKELTVIAGKADRPGKPLLYRTSEAFLDYFGINSLDDLPELEDLEPEQPELFSNINKLEQERGEN
jgi:segregation and condensation protein B